MVYSYHIKYVKYTNKIPAELFRYLLFYIKPDKISINIPSKALLKTFHYIPIHFNIGSSCSFHGTCSNIAGINDYTYLEFQTLSKECTKIYKISRHYS